MTKRTHRPVPNRNVHPAEGDLRAYLDGELSSFAALRVALHMRRCRACADAAAELRTLDARASSLLRAFTPGRTPRASRHRRGIGFALATLVSAAAAIALWMGASPTTHATASGVYRLHDVCCFNLDGGEHADDGMLTVSRAGEVVDCVLLYEDRAGTKRFAQRDPLRFAGGEAAAARCGPSLLAEVQSAIPIFRRGS